MVFFLVKYLWFPYQDNASGMIWEELNFLYAIVNGIVFRISFSACLLLVIFAFDIVPWIRLLALIANIGSYHL